MYGVARPTSDWMVEESESRWFEARLVSVLLYCSLVKKLCSTLSLFTQVYKWVPVTYCWANPVMDQYPIQGRSSNTPWTSHFMLGIL